MISGMLVVDKTQAETSHDVVDKVRKCLRMKRVGHFGTLDPMAEGILLIGLGKATKFFDFYKEKEKLYVGKIIFGFATSTYDKEGTPIGEKKEIDLNTIDISALLQRFTGEIEQIPPMYSAKKYKGKPLYKYARANQTINVKPARVTIHALQGTILDKHTMEFEALTSSGTYIRSLAHDIGEAVGSGAYLDQLRRVRVGEFDHRSAIASSKLTAGLDREELLSRITPIEGLLPEFPKIIIGPAGKRGVANGRFLETKDIIKIIGSGEGTHFRLFDEEGNFLAVAKKDEALRRFNPTIVLHP